jgi:hypothetical protein
MRTLSVSASKNSSLLNTKRKSAGWDWNLRGELQLSNRNLLGSEQFSDIGDNSRAHISVQFSY